MHTEPMLFLVGLLTTAALPGAEQATPPPSPAEQPKPVPSGSPPPRPARSTPAPAAGFTPSERIKADQSVAFPVDI